MKQLDEVLVLGTGQVLVLDKRSGFFFPTTSPSSFFGRVLFRGAVWSRRVHNGGGPRARRNSFFKSFSAAGGWGVGRGGREGAVIFLE